MILSRDKKEISGRRVVLTSIFVDIIDIFMNGVVALVTGSVVMLTEVLQGVADLISDLMAYLGIERSDNKPTDLYPLGFGREVFFWTLLSSLVMLFVLAGSSIYFGWQRLLASEEINFIALTFLVLTISVITNGYSFSLSFRRLIKWGNEKSIYQQFLDSTKAESKITFISDAVGSLAALTGLVALLLYQITGNTRFDSFGAIAIGIIMALFAFILLLNTRGFLIGRSISKEDKDKVRQVISLFPQVVDIIYLKAVSFGANQTMVHLGLNLINSLTTDEIEILIDKLEGQIKEALVGEVNILVEVEGPKK